VHARHACLLCMRAMQVLIDAKIGKIEAILQQPFII
jgi:hypothetical protein